MKTVFAALFLLLSLSTLAQKDTVVAPFRKFPVLPPFDLLQPDSSHLTRDRVSKKSPTLLMFFSPDCPHCQHQTEALISGMDSLKEVQIIMATYQPMEELVSFIKKYQLARFPNIHLGRDVKFFLPPYFRMKSLPYLALFDRKGSLITTFEGNQTTLRLVNAFDGKTK